MRRVFLGIALLCFIINNDHSASVSENENKTYDNDSVYVNGTDITQQLKSDLNAGLNVDLPSGHYYVSESIIITGYSGIVKGAEKDSTIIEAKSTFKAMEDTLFPGYMLTEIFAIYFIAGDVTFQDMTIKVTGAAPAEIHNNPFLGEVTTIDNAIVVSGTDAVDSVIVTFKNLKIIGEYSDDRYSVLNRNLVFPLIAAGSDGSESISTIIENCEIEYSGHAAIEYFDSKGGSGEISNNKITNCHSGIWLGSADSGSFVNIENNIFQNITGDVIDINSTNWSICIMNNILDGMPIPDNCPSTSISEQPSHVNQYHLSQNYPNPFNPSTIINYELPITNDVELSIYNLLGQKVAILVSEKQKAGIHQVEWDASGFASGIYYYQIKAGEFQDVKKMILLR